MAISKLNKFKPLGISELYLLLSLSDLYNSGFQGAFNMEISIKIQEITADSDIRVIITHISNFLEEQLKNEFNEFNK